MAPSVTPRRGSKPHPPLAGIDSLRLQHLLTVVALPAVPLVGNPLQALGAAPPASGDVPIVKPAGLLLAVAPAQVLLVEGPVVVAAVVLTAEWPRAHGAAVVRGGGGRGIGGRRGSSSGRDFFAPLAATIITEVQLDGLFVYVFDVPVEVSRPPEWLLTAALIKTLILR